MLDDDPGRLPSCSDTHAFTCEVCIRRELLVCSGTWRTFSSAASFRLRQQVRKTLFRLGLTTVFRCAAEIRPTDFCHHFHLRPAPALSVLRLRIPPTCVDREKLEELTLHGVQARFGRMAHRTIRGTFHSSTTIPSSHLTPLSPARSFAPPSQAIYEVFVRAKTAYSAPP